MGTSTIIATGTQWLWNQYGDELVKKAWFFFRGKWAKFGWEKAEKVYRERLFDLHSTTRLLGYQKPVSIEGIYTDVYILNEMSALRHLGAKELLSMSEDEIKIQPQEAKKIGERQSALFAVSRNNHLLIVGKPGSGKTTLLKYLTLQACKGKMAETPIFISLKDWSDSEQSLHDFIIQQFEICGFPDPRPFVIYLLKKGKTLVMFDGLDEVEQSKNAQAISAINDFCKRFSKAKIIVTCRIAAVDYIFSGFAYVEIADFSREQIFSFCQKWYQDSPSKFKKFMSEIQRKENERLYELAKTPLLLALLCLVFDETMMLPKRRVDLYKEAFDALLKKWDASRGIRRDEIYQRLPPRRKEQLLSTLATQNFVEGKYFIPKNTLIWQIEQYIEKLPPSDIDGKRDIEPESMLRAIESQHGLLVERAYNVYSFSHLTFQEYLVARYIVENASIGALDDLYDYLDNNKWREVVFMVASLLDNADALFQRFVTKQQNIAGSSSTLQAILNWINEGKSQRKNRLSYIDRMVMLLVALVLIRLRRLKTLRGEISMLTVFIKNIYQLLQSQHQKLDQDISRRIDKVIFNTLTTDAIKALDPKPILSLCQTLNIELNDFPIEIIEKYEDEFNSSMAKYLHLSSLFLECLDVAIASNRSLWQSKMFTLTG
jgi:predicted NACHT family NTPase